jgi:hypothetical protein
VLPPPPPPPPPPSATAALRSWPLTCLLSSSLSFSLSLSLFSVRLSVRLYMMPLTRWKGAEPPFATGAISSCGGSIPARPFPSSICHDKNRRDIGKSQSIWTDSKMETARLPWAAEDEPPICGGLIDPGDAEPCRPAAPGVRKSSGGESGVSGDDTGVVTDPSLSISSTPPFVRRHTVGVDPPAAATRRTPHTQAGPAGRGQILISPHTRSVT